MGNLSKEEVRNNKRPNPRGALEKRGCEIFSTVLCRNARDTFIIKLKRVNILIDLAGFQHKKTYQGKYS